LLDTELALLTVITKFAHAEKTRYNSEVVGANTRNTYFYCDRVAYEAVENVGAGGGREDWL
jgi:hypothetical protein